MIRYEVKWLLNSTETKYTSYLCSGAPVSTSKKFISIFVLTTHSGIFYLVSNLIHQTFAPVMVKAIHKISPLKMTENGYRHHIIQSNIPRGWRYESNFPQGPKLCLEFDHRPFKSISMVVKTYQWMSKVLGIVNYMVTDCARQDCRVWYVTEEGKWQLIVCH